MALKKFHLLGDRYLFDDYDTGLYFDLAPVSRNPGDENALDGRIGDMNGSLVETDPANQNYACTVFLTKTQYDAMNPKYPVQFGAKSYLLLFLNNFNGETLPNNPWFGSGGGGMVCNVNGADNKKWIYYTNWDGGALYHRFRRVQKSEVLDYLASIGQTMPVEEPPANPPAGENPDNPPAPTGVWDGVLHLACPHCGMKIF